MDYKKVLADLIGIDTTVPPGRNYDRAIDYLKPLFEAAGCETESIAIPAEHAEGRQGRINLICRRRSPDKPRLIFYGHIDVVPAEGWDAFTPRTEDGKMYGRGSADMKGGIVALLLGLEALRGQQAAYDITVILTTDEETSQGSQLQYIRQFIEPVAGSRFISLDCNFGYVSITALGALHADIVIKGKSVHSALSHLGENAVENAVPVMQELLRLKKGVESRKSKVPAHPDTGLELMTARLNINMIRGGLKVNIVPDECVLSIDRRLIPEETMEDAKRELYDAISRAAVAEWEVRSETTIPAAAPVTDPLAGSISDAIRKVTGESGEYGEMGSGDLGHTVEGWKSTMLGLGVIRPGCNIHGRDEFVHLADVENLGRIIYLFLREE